MRSYKDLPSDFNKTRVLYERAATLLRPVPRMSPTEWARWSRQYPETAARPGQRDPEYTPYIVPFCDAVEGSQYQTIVMVCGSQQGKTDAVLDLMGWRLYTRPRPQLYVGPSKDFITDQFEPRLMALFDEAPELKDRVLRGKRAKITRKVISGVPVRLAWAGSATQLSSDQAGDVYVDELDRMGADVEHEGDPLTLARARAFTYGASAKIIVTSTPKSGLVDTAVDPVSGLEFWQPADPLNSPIWRLWQSGTRHHWTWPCPECGKYFVPRAALLKWPEGASAHDAKEFAYIECPHCQGQITERHKRDLNRRGRAVAPGQTIDDGGNVVGEPEPSNTFSLWVSGLASPFVSFGSRASDLIEARETLESGKIQAAVNTAFGELYAPGGGEAPELAELISRRRESGYKRGEVPDGVIHAVLACDVQKDRIIWVIRGFGVRATSWLIDHGSLWGDTVESGVWDDLAALLTDPLPGGLHIRLAMVDSGFRPGKPHELPLNRIYEFCRRFPRTVRATKGASGTMRTPIIISRPEVTAKGKVVKYGIDLVRLDTNHWKSWVHERIRWPGDATGAWHVPHDVEEDYLRQLLSEARVTTPAGSVRWILRSRQNHFLDCESQAAAAASILGCERLSTERAMQLMAQRARGAPERDDTAPDFTEQAAQAAAAARETNERARDGRSRSSGSDWLGNTSNWL